ncbi:transposase [Clostridium sp. Mt-5]|uniref:Transposase n=1 Tax=Clostridium moutaii TaxID=3240932 RepID=A0ABV4BTA9_9CLOT
MGKTSKRYTDEYKNTIVELFNRGKTYSELNSEYGIPKTTMRQWVLKNKNKKDGTEAKEQNIKGILKKNVMLQEENEILKKALSIFAKEK